MTDIENPMEYYLKIPSVKFVSETVKDRGNPLIYHHKFLTQFIQKQQQKTVNLDEQFYIPLKYANFRNLIPI
jgi:hypothetical protein